MPPPPFPFPSTVPDWLAWIFCRFMANGVQLPGEPNVNFLSPLTAVDNPGNRSIDIGFTGGVLAYAGTPVTSTTYQILANNSVGFNTYLNPVALSTPTSIIDGTRFQAYDAGRIAGSDIVVNNATLSDAGGLLIQNPIDLEYYATITWGAGSGGGANPPLPRGFCGTWQRTTVTGSLGTKTYFQSVQGA